MKHQEIERQLRELRAEVDELRASTPGFDPAAFRRELERLVTRTDSDHLRGLARSYDRGEIDRRGLRRDPEYRAALADWYREHFADLRDQGLTVEAAQAELDRREQDRRNDPSVLR